MVTEKKIVTLAMFTLDTREHKVERTDLSCKQRDGCYYPLSNSPYISPDRDIMEDSLGQFHSCKGYYRMICLKEDANEVQAIFTKKCLEALSLHYKGLNKMLLQAEGTANTKDKLEELLELFDADYKESKKPVFNFYINCYVITVPELTDSLIPNFETYIHYTVTHSKPNSLFNDIGDWCEGIVSLPNCYLVEFNKKGKATVGTEPHILPIYAKDDPMVNVSKSVTKVGSMTNKHICKVINRNIEEYFIKQKASK